MIIYKITNKINGMIYIGQTAKSVDKRWSEHCHEKRNRHFSNAIRKYGKNAFSVEIVGTYINQEDLNNAEQYFIEYHNCLSPSGYNYQLGGSYHGCHESTKIKIAATLRGKPGPNLGKVYTQELKDKISNSLKGQVSPNKGKPMSEEQKIKLSKALTGRKLTEKHKSAIKAGLANQPAPAAT